MPNIRRPHRGSRGFWPRKRAKRIYPRVTTWAKSNDSKALGFAGYKAGMSHAFIIDTNTNSRTKGQLLTRPVTIIECPHVSVLGFRCYSGSKVIGDVLSEKLDKKLSRKMNFPVKYNTADQMKNIENKKISHVHLICYTNPVFKKTPEVFEVALGGDKQLETAKNFLGKQIKISDVFKEGDYVDVIAITKGKGFVGPVKRFGVKIMRPKVSQMERHVGSLGTTEPGKVRSTVPQAGQMGFGKRTELNKRIYKFAKPEEVNPKGGFTHFGTVKTECVIIEGSVPGPKKRLIRIRGAIRPPKTVYPVDFKSLSLESQQG